MIALNHITNPLHRRFYQYAVFGFIALSLGYLLREQISPKNALVSLLLGSFPNLTGSFATPFILTFLIAQKYPSWNGMSSLSVFGLINLFTFAVCVLIEYLHVLFQLGRWDANDIAASIIGGLLSMVLFMLTRRMAGRRQEQLKTDD